MQLIAMYHLVCFIWNRKFMISKALFAYAMVVAAIAHADDIYVSDMGANAIYKINSSSMVKTKIAEIEKPYSLAIELTGNILVLAANDSSRLANLTKEKIQEISYRDVGKASLAVDSHATIVAANAEQGEIYYAFKTGGRDLLARGIPNVFSPCFNSRNELFVIGGDPEFGYAVYKVSNKTAVNVFEMGVVMPAALAINSNDDLILQINHTTGSTIMQVTMSGDAKRIYSSKRQFSNLVIGSQDNWFVTDPDGSIYRIANGGESKIASGFSQLSDLLIVRSNSTAHAWPRQNLVSEILIILLLLFGLSFGARKFKIKKKWHTDL